MYSAIFMFIYATFVKHYIENMLLLWLLLLLLLSALRILVEEPVEKRSLEDIMMDIEAVSHEDGMWMEQAEVHRAGLSNQGF
jgi:hypothetical protein